MPNVEKRAPGVFRLGVQSREGGTIVRRRKAFRCDPSLPDEEQRALAMEAAEAYERELLDDPAQGRTLSDLAAIWFRDHVDMSVKPTTAKTYHSLMEKRILPALGSLRPDQLTPQRMAAFLRRLSTTPAATTALPPDQRRRTSDRTREPSPVKPLSQKTIRHIYDTLSYMLQKCRQWNLIKENPLDRVDRPKAAPPHLQFLDMEDASRLLSLILQDGRPSLRIGVALALLAGLRLGEADAVTWADINYAAGTLRINKAETYTPGTGAIISDPKTLAGIRTISIPPLLLSILSAEQRNARFFSRYLDKWRGEYVPPVPAEAPPPADIIPNPLDTFPAPPDQADRPPAGASISRLITNIDGSPVAQDTASKQFRKWAAENGFTGIRFHDLRHTHASLLLASSMDVVTVSAHMGHSSPDVTMRTYAHPVHQRDAAAAAALQSIFSPESK